MKVFFLLLGVIAMAVAAPPVTSEAPVVLASHNRINNGPKPTPEEIAAVNYLYGLGHPEETAIPKNIFTDAANTGWGLFGNAAQWVGEQTQKVGHFIENAGANSKHKVV